MLTVTKVQTQKLGIFTCYMNNNNNNNNNNVLTDTWILLEKKTSSLISNGKEIALINTLLHYSILFTGTLKILISVK